MVKKATIIEIGFGGSFLIKRSSLVVLFLFVLALVLVGCDASNATSGVGGGAVGNTPPNPANASGGNAYATTGNN